MKPPAVGSVWVMRDDRYKSASVVPVKVIATDERWVVTTHPLGCPARDSLSLGIFRDTYKKAPEGTPDPVVWPPAAVPVDGALIVRLGDVPVGWLFRDGWEEPGEWSVREDDDGSYDGALVECRPPAGVV